MFLLWDKDSPRRAEHRSDVSPDPVPPFHRRHRRSHKEQVEGVEMRCEAESNVSLMMSYRYGAI